LPFIGPTTDVMTHASDLSENRTWQLGGE